MDATAVVAEESVSEHCQARLILYGTRTSHSAPPRCPELAVPDRLYCERHLREALARVAMVSPVDTIRGRPVPELERPG